MAAYPHYHPYALLSGTIILALNHKLLLGCLHLTQWIPFIKQAMPLHTRKRNGYPWISHPQPSCSTSQEFSLLHISLPIIRTTNNHHSQEAPLVSKDEHWGSSLVSSALVASLILHFCHNPADHAKNSYPRERQTSASPLKKKKRTKKHQR